MGTKVLPAVGMTACLEGALKRHKKKTVSHYSVPGMIRMVAPPSDIEVYILRVGFLQPALCFRALASRLPSATLTTLGSLPRSQHIHQAPSKHCRDGTRMHWCFGPYLRAASATLSCTRQSFSILTLSAECSRNVSICHQRIRMSGPNICNSIASPSRRIATASACLPDASFNNVARLFRVVKI